MKNFARTRRPLFFSLLGLLLAVIAGLGAYRFYESRKPQPIHVAVSVSAPENALGSREAQPLVLNFYGSAAPVDMTDKEVPEGIRINPPMEGLWRWEGEAEFYIDPEDSSVKRVLATLRANYPMVTIYAAHFLTEARNSGYYVAPGIMARLLQALRTIADGGDSAYRVSCCSYAIYVLTLNEVVTTTLIESLKRDVGSNSGELETGFTGQHHNGNGIGK